MSEETEIFVGVPTNITGKSLPHPCADCGGLAWFTEEMLSKLKVTPEPKKVICLNCLPDEDFEALSPLKPETIRAVQLAGGDLTGKQMHKIVLDMLRRGKP